MLRELILEQLDGKTVEDKLRTCLYNKEKSNVMYTEKMYIMKEKEGYDVLFFEWEGDYLYSASVRFLTRDQVEILEEYGRTSTFGKCGQTVINRTTSTRYML